jgi:TRAP-type mannitol/chloroaromatic compound transport system permease small subunit
MHISMGMLLIMMFLGIADVIFRYFLKTDHRTLEVSRFFSQDRPFSLAYAQYAKAHIAVDVFSSRFPPRVQAIVGLAITFGQLSSSLLLLESDTSCHRSLAKRVGRSQISWCLFILLILSFQ